MEIKSCFKMIFWTVWSSGCTKGCFLPINLLPSCPESHMATVCHKMSENLAVGKGFSKTSGLGCRLNFKCLCLTDPLPLSSLEANQNSQAGALKGIYFLILFSLAHAYTFCLWEQSARHALVFGSWDLTVLPKHPVSCCEAFSFFPPFLLTQ